MLCSRIRVFAGETGMERIPTCAEGCYCGHLSERLLPKTEAESLSWNAASTGLPWMSLVCINGTVMLAHAFSPCSTYRPAWGMAQSEFYATVRQA